MVFLTDIHAIGLENAQGLYVSSGFYWNQNDPARAWSKRFFAQHHRMPMRDQAMTYAVVLQYLRAAETAGTADATATVRRMKQMPVDYFGHPASIRSDGRVLYGEPSVTDLAVLAQRLGLSAEEVVALHAGVESTIYFVGFAPGLPNLAGLPPALHLPRPRIPAGSVVMAGAQTGVISTPVPSGWHILGHSPIRPFDPSRLDPFLFRPGDLVRIRPGGIRPPRGQHRTRRATHGGGSGAVTVPHLLALAPSPFVTLQDAGCRAGSASACPPAAPWTSRRWPRPTRWSR